MDESRMRPARKGYTESPSRGSQEPDVLQEDPAVIDEFLDDIFRNNSEVCTDDRVRKGVSTALDGQFGEPLETVMRDLCLLNSTDSPDEEAVTAALTRYRRCKHILISETRIKLLRSADENVTKSISKGESSMKEVRTRAQTVGIPDQLETLEQFLERHSKFCHPISNVSFYDSEQAQLSQEKNSSMIDVKFLDSLLGIAGFRPEKILSSISSDGRDKKNEQKVLKEEVWKETLGHVKVERIGSEFDAEVSLRPFSSFATHEQDINEIFQDLLAIISIYSRVGKVKEALRRMGSLSNEIVYLKRRGVSSKRSLGLVDTGAADLLSSDEHIIETVSLNTETLEELLAIVNEFYDKFKRETSAKPETNGGWGWGWGIISTAIVAAVNFIGTAFGFPALIGLGVWAAVKVFKNGWDSATNDERRVAVADFQGAAGPIISRLQLPAPQSVPISPSVLQQDKATLHKIALTGQLLSLILQSHLRGSCAPLEFEDFIDCPISSFRLRGTDPKAASIYAFRQKLSCFPDQSVLVFDSTGVGSSSAPQLLTTPAHMMILWQPVSLLIQTKNARNDGRNSCLGLAAMGGIISPSQTSEAGPHLWCWNELQELDIKALSERTLPATGLHDKIRLESYYEAVASKVQEARSIDVSSQTTERVASSEHLTVASAKDSDTLVQISTSSDTAESVSDNIEGSEGKKSFPLQGVTTDNSLACPWEAKEAEEKRKLELSPRCDQSGTAPSHFELEGIQVGAGCQPPVGGFGPQVAGIFSFHPQTSLKTMLRRKTSDLIGDLDQYCCAFLSLHTGVVERVRLRDMVAHFASATLVSAATYQLDDIIPLLKSNLNMLEEIKKLSESLEGKEDRQHPEVILNRLIKETLGQLGNTGISRRKHLVTLWPGQPFEQLTISQRKGKWLPILSDTSTTSTFACIVPNCKETEECKCKMAQSAASPQSGKGPIEWEFPGRLRLKTTLLAKKKDEDKEQKIIPLTSGRAYWINSTRLSLIGKVLGSTKSREGKRLFYLSVRSTLVPGFLMKHFKAYQKVIEKSGASSFDCVLGSGDEFEREVLEHLG